MCADEREVGFGGCLEIFDVGSFQVVLLEGIVYCLTLRFSV